MSRTGGVSFYEPSQCLEVDGASIVVSSGTGSGPNVLDRNPETFWRSASSDDTITETLTIDFGGEKTISRLFVLDHNWKDFNIKYDSGGGVFVHFSSVFGLDGAKANITETVFADDTAYYEFAEVTTQSIQIEVLKTQIVDQEKHAAQIIVTSEIGTFVGYPVVKDVEIDRNSRVQKTLSGKHVVQKSVETKSLAFDFKNYPASSVYNVDMDLALTLLDREIPFLVWLCGGRRGSTYFRYTLRGFRLKDLIQMQVSKAYKLGYADNIYHNGLNAKIQLEEHI